MKSRKIIFTTVLSALVCFGLCQQVQSATDTPDPGPLPTSNTGDGQLALGSITTGIHNSAFGFFALLSNGAANFNTGVGSGTLLVNTANENTAVGAAALLNNTTGGDNNAVGAFALFEMASGSFNNAHGRNALLINVDGSENEAFGDLALSASAHDSHNTAIGDDALLVQNGGDSNTAVGREAGDTVTTGSHNVFLGDFAGAGVVTSSNNIAIGALAVGPFADLGHTCFIGSIDGEPTSDAGSTVAVLIDSNNVLGTAVSSRRYKHDIKPMDKASEVILALKPVTFKYNSDVKGTPCFGLIAEDVAQVDRDLVVRNKNGEVQTVRYEQINAMLLNEFLKEHQKVEEQQASIGQLKSEMQTMVAQLKEQAAQIQKVSAQVEVNKPAPEVVVNKP